MTPAHLSARPSHLHRAVALLLLAGALLVAPAATAAAASVRAQLTPLEAYVQSPDPHYGYQVESVTKNEGYRTVVVRMTSQAWLTEDEVDRPVWWHWLVIVVPDSVTTDKAMMFIGGGDNEDPAPEAASPMIVAPALATHSIAAELRMVPNQPITFAGDDYGPRKEDELIAYGWREFLRGGARDHDALWLARLPMTKAVVRALDTVEAMVAKGELLAAVAPTSWVVAGGSKRGWTTWTTAIVDSRVVAIAPFVIDMLNVVPSFAHHWRVYGFWSPAVADYRNLGLMDWSFRPEYARMMEITEPYSYRDRLTLPKYIVNATGDEFFLPDSWQFYWQDLVGEKNLRYVPNANHSLADTDAPQSFVAFYRMIVEDAPRPRFDWRIEGSDIVVVTDEEHPPSAIKLWRASNPRRRDFRVVTIRKTWESEDIEQREDGHYRVTVPEPEEGYVAFLVELTFPGPGPETFKVTTGVHVLPQVLPFEPFQPDPSVWQTQP